MGSDGPEITGTLAEPEQAMDRNDALADEPPPVSADDGAVLHVESVRILDAKGVPTTKLEQGEEFTIALDVLFHQQLSNISAGFLIKDQFGQELTGESVFNTYRRSLDVNAGQRVCFRFSSNMLLRGGQSYSCLLYTSRCV